MLCSRCKKEYPRTKKYFALDKKRKDGLSSQCRACRYKGIKKWRLKNKEKCREYAQKHYQQNRENEYKRTKEYCTTFSGYCVKLIGQIKQRCKNQYNKHGIKLCFTRIELQKWLKQNNIDPRGLEIHRINNDGNYSLDNITFLTKSRHTTLHNKE